MLGEKKNLKAPDLASAWFSSLVVAAGGAPVRASAPGASVTLLRWARPLSGKLPEICVWKPIGPLAALGLDLKRQCETLHRVRGLLFRRSFVLRGAWKAGVA